MKISGFQKTSLIDYPGKIVSIIFTQGCNFKCPYCHNSDLIPMENEKNDYFPTEYIFNFLEKRKKLIDGVSITGGEPTLQLDLYDFIKKIKDLKLAVKLDTNGGNPVLLKTLIIENLIDYIAMDIKGPLERYNKVSASNINTKNILNSIKTIQNSNLDYEFRTTVVPGIHTENDLYQIANLLKGSKKYYIQNFKANNTYDPYLMNINGFSPSMLKKFKDIVNHSIKFVGIRD